ncbi:MAG: 3-hydroxyacyl-CoA dehydrogenase family protein, partial [Ideonella sp.]
RPMVSPKDGTATKLGNLFCNRIQHAMVREALYLIDEGVVSAEDVDTAVRFGFGFRLIACGPILQKEMSGWDTNYRAGSALYPHLHNEATVPDSIRQMVERGHTGMKALHGMWQWTEQGVAAEKARIEGLLVQALELLRADR